MRNWYFRFSRSLCLRFPVLFVGWCIDVDSVETDDPENGGLAVRESWDNDTSALAAAIFGFWLPVSLADVDVNSFEITDPEYGTRTNNSEAGSLHERLTYMDGVYYVVGVDWLTLPKSVKIGSE